MRGVSHVEDFGWSGVPRFGGGGGGTTSTNTVQNSDPWLGQQASLMNIYGQAATNNAQNIATGSPGYYPGNTYAPLTGQQQGLMSNLIGYTGSGGGPAIQAADANIQQSLSPGATAQTQGTFNGANSYLNGVLDPNYTSMTGGEFGNANYANDQMLQPGFTSLAQGEFNNSNYTLDQMLQPTFNAGANATGGAANNTLNSELMSSYLNPNNSPAYQTAVSNAITAAVPQATAGFVNGNRSGGGLAAAAASSAAANAAGGLAQQQYSQNQAIQQNAIQQAQSQQNTQNQQQQQAVGQAASNVLGLQGQQQQAIGQASSNLLNQQQQQGNAAALASGNLLTQQGNQTKDLLTAPMIDQAGAANIGTALNTAGMSQQDQQNQLNADIARYNYGQMLPWNQLSLYENAITGTGSPGSSSSSTGTQPYFTNPVANAASAASAAAGLGMLAFTAFSDRDLKADIQKIGMTDNDLPLYSFRYKWDGPMSRHIGLIAQDVEKKVPSAVIYTPMGRMVDYMEALAA